MKAICVDDEVLLARRAAALCSKLPEIDGAEPFTRAADALSWLSEHEAELALLDIDMPDISGIELAEKIKQEYPKIKIIVLTAYPQFAVDAFRLHASGYLLKPIDPEALASEVAYALSDRTAEKQPSVKVKTFGGFDVFAKGNMVSFHLAKSKELLALLVDRKGLSLSRAEAFSILWEDRLYDRPMQKQFDVIIRSMRDTLREYGIDAIFEMKNGRLRIRPEMIECDMYRFFEGDADAFNAYRGEYMNAYPWAVLSESDLSRRRMYMTGH